MAVVIASDLAKDMAGEPLLRGVSFKLERRDRLTLAGRNGAGKTTLLRMLAGETSIDGGELTLRQGRPRSRCTTSARRASATSACATTCSSGCGDLLALEARLAELEQAMAAGRPTPRRSTPTRARRRGSSTPAATPGARASTRRCTASASATRDLDRRLRDVLRRRADPRLARARAGRRPRPAAARRADQPPRHRVARVAREPPAEPRRRRRARRPRPLVPRGGRHRRARARGRPRALLQGHLARVAQGEGGARAGARPGDREARRPRSRGSSASSTASARARARARRSRAPSSSTRSSASTRDPRDGAALGFAFKPPERSGRVVFEVEDGDAAVGDRDAARATPSSGSSAASTSRWSAPTAPARRR